MVLGGCVRAGMGWGMRHIGRIVEILFDTTVRLHSRLDRM